MSGQDSIYAMVTDRIVNLLNQGTVPWHKPWTGGGAPKSMATGKTYRGINSFILECAGYASPLWLTIKQVNERGGRVRKGEKGVPVVFWKQWETERRDTGEMVRIPLLRYYTVFNAEQCEGLEGVVPQVQRHEHKPIQEAEQVVASMPKRPEIVHREARAYYSPILDIVNLPSPDLFELAEEYYSAAFHELTHSTGHESRLARRPSTEARHFGDTAYSREELVAEMGAAFLCGHVGIAERTVDNSAAYIGGWLKALRDDKKLVVVAAAQAQRAADFILGIQYGQEA